MGKILLELNGTQPVQEAPLLLNGAEIFSISPTPGDKPSRN
jgi:hypothetical protein